MLASIWQIMGRRRPLTLGTRTVIDCLGVIQVHLDYGNQLPRPMLFCHHAKLEQCLDYPKRYRTTRRYLGLTRRCSHAR